MTFAIRAMQSGDLEAVLLIAAESPEAPQWPRLAYTPYLAADPGNSALRRAAWVATDEGGPAVHAFACATLLLDGVQNLCQLDSTAVLPTVRRQGIGAALLRESLGWAARSGARHFSLEVRASNSAAIGLYRRFGLRPEGRRARYYADPEEDALLLGIQVTLGGYDAAFPP
ncbi:MAG: GNAT family N-acetyltransferase [Acidobacteriota bacterium]